MLKKYLTQPGLDPRFLGVASDFFRNPEKPERLRETLEISGHPGYRHPRRKG